MLEPRGGKRKWGRERRAALHYEYATIQAAYYFLHASPLSLSLIQVVGIRMKRVRATRVSHTHARARIIVRARMHVVSFSKERRTSAAVCAQQLRE